jgi:hypothetical protein
MALAMTLSTGLAHADDDPMAPYRDRFRAGMEKYTTGHEGEAIQFWEPIYREIGPQKGYRLAFDLARAYEHIGDSTHGAERYESFLAELTARRGAGEVIDDRVLREEGDARQALAGIKVSKGRIKVNPGSRPVPAQIDAGEPRFGSFVAYVAPGTHVVTFAAGGSATETHDVTVKAGEMVEVAPHSEPATQTPPPDNGPSTPPQRPPPPPPPKRFEKEHPFSPVVLYTGAALTAVSVVAPILTYAHAWSLADNYNSKSSTGPEKTSDANAYSSAKSAAYATLGIPIGLAVVTAGLTAWYFGGTKDREVAVGAAPMPGGGSVSVGGRF